MFSTAMANLSCILGRTWLYVSRVMVTLEWPKASDTTFGFLPASNAKVAKAWRRPWKVRWGF